MLMELTPAQHQHLRPLFVDFGTRLHGCVEAIFSGGFGRAWADDSGRPTVAVAHLDFWFVAGDHTTPGAVEALRMVPEGGTIVTAGRVWDELVRKTLGAKVSEHTRTAFSTPRTDAWNRHRLREAASSLPDGFSIRRVTAADIDSFSAVDKDLITNFGTIERFLEAGLGFGVWFDGRYIAGCSSYTLANGKLEIEIDTHPDFRRRGLARAVAATIILYCLDHAIEPCWDAHNTESGALAEQLGFVDPRPYTVLRVG